MKKTLIVILALSSVALRPVVLATEFKDYSSILTGGTTIFENTDPLYSDSSFSLVVNMNVDQLISQLSTTGTTHTNATIVQLTLGLTGTPSSQDICFSSIYTSTQATTASLWTSLNGGKNGRTNLSGTSNVYLSEVAETDWVGATGAALCITYDKTAGTNTYLTIQMPEADDIVYTTKDKDLKYGTTRGINGISLNTDIVKQCYTYMEVLTADEASTISKKAMNVPEPTTGSLSLLALAGLCARRRRK